MSIDNKAIREKELNTTHPERDWEAFKYSESDVDAIQSATRIDERNEVIDEIREYCNTITCQDYNYKGNLLLKLTQLRSENENAK